MKNRLPGDNFGKFIFWWRCTPKLEPISSVKAELYRLSPNACGCTRPLALPENPLNYLFEISPANLLFFN